MRAQTALTDHTISQRVLPYENQTTVDFSTCNPPETIHDNIVKQATSITENMQKYYSSRQVKLQNLLQDKNVLSNIQKD